MKGFKKKIHLPTTTEKTTVINLHSVSALEVVEQILQKEIIDKISFIQYGSGKSAYITIRDLLEINKILNIEFFMSDFIIKMNQSLNKLIHEINDKYGKTEVKYYTNHVKIVLIKTVTGKHFVINSTSNFGSSSKIEQTEVTQSIEDYNFYRNFALEHFT